MLFFFFKRKTAYEMLISDWSSDVCSSYLQQDGDYRDDPHEDFGEEAGSRLGRARRYAQVGTSVGGLAAQIVGARYLGFGLDRGRHSSDLKAALGGLKDRKSVVSGKSVSVRVDLGGRRIIKKKKERIKES